VVVAERVAEKVEVRFSYWDELIKSGTVTEEQAERLKALTQENRLTFDGRRIPPEKKTGIQSIVCEIYFVWPYVEEYPMLLGERRTLLSEIWLTFDPKLKKDQMKPFEKRQLCQRRVPEEIINFLVEGLHVNPNHWNPHSMALFETSYIQFTATEEYNIFQYGNPKGNQLESKRKVEDAAA